MQVTLMRARPSRRAGQRAGVGHPRHWQRDAAIRPPMSMVGTTQLTTYSYSNAGETTEERGDSLGIRAIWTDPQSRARRHRAPMVNRRGKAAGRGGI